MKINLTRNQLRDIAAAVSEASENYVDSYDSLEREKGGARWHYERYGDLSIALYAIIRGETDKVTILRGKRFRDIEPVKSALAPPV